MTRRSTQCLNMTMLTKLINMTCSLIEEHKNATLWTARSIDKAGEPEIPIAQKVSACPLFRDVGSLLVESFTPRLVRMSGLLSLDYEPDAVTRAVLDYSPGDSGAKTFAYGRSGDDGRDDGLALGDMSPSAQRVHNIIEHTRKSTFVPWDDVSAALLDLGAGVGVICACIPSGCIPVPV